MIKLYDCVCGFETAAFLQNKVFVDVMIHFGRRGRENLRLLKRTDFAISTDSSGDRYIYLTDEQTKNHQDDDEGAEGCMYEVKDNDRCPVKSFMKYIRRLNPLCMNFSQQPRDEPIEGIYYKNCPLGYNKLGNMMRLISEEAGLSRKYTNHSLRATTVHVLDVAMIPSRHSMTVTGHKSETSLKTYSGHTDVKTKKLMSKTLSEKCNALVNSNFTAQKQQPVALQNQLELNMQPLQQVPAIENELDDGLDELFRNVPMPPPLNSFSGPAPVLNNCTNVTINCNCYFK